MAIYAVQATKEGKQALEQLANAERDDVPFLSAVILARVQDTTVFGDISSFLSEEYATTIAEGGITNAIHKLEQLGFVKIFREITGENKITVKHEGIEVLTTLGDFLRRNRSAGLVELIDICDTLKWKGEVTIRVLNVPVCIKLA